jgi:hypothetical protein
MEQREEFDLMVEMEYEVQLLGYSKIDSHLLS